jgi:hypothetical protein
LLKFDICKKINIFEYTQVRYNSFQTIHYLQVYTIWIKSVIKITGRKDKSLLTSNGECRFPNTVCALFYSNSINSGRTSEISIHFCNQRHFCKNKWQKITLENESKSLSRSFIINYVHVSFYKVNIRVHIHVL